MPDTLAEIVLADGLIRKTQLRKAADRADELRVPIIVSLVKEFDLDEVGIVAAIRRHLRVDLLDPGKVDFDPEALREVGADEAKRLRAVPISVAVYGTGPRLLRVAMADPTDTIALKELEHLTGCQIEPVLATLSAVEEMTEVAYRHIVTAVMSRSRQNVAKPPVVGSRSLGPEWERASTDARLEALVELCLDKKVFSPAELSDALQRVRKNSSD